MFEGFLINSPFANSPDNSLSKNDTIDGVVDSPISFCNIFTSPFFHIPITEYVVPKSIPIAGQCFDILYLFFKFIN